MVGSLLLWLYDKGHLWSQPVTDPFNALAAARLPGMLPASRKCPRKHKAYQFWGTGVGSSDLPAPTNEIKNFAVDTLRLGTSSALH